MVQNKRCIYCHENKVVKDFSEEHIIPQFMGGSSDCPAAITHDVCQQCNSRFGRFVDASVAKTFFLNSNEGGAWRGCFDYDAKHGNVFPLIYFGKSQEIQCPPGEEVEMWLCPDGGTAWDFHESRGDDFETFAGGDPYLRRKDQKSRVYAFFASLDPYWLFSNFKSVPAHFKEEPIFLGADSDIEAQLLNQRLKGQFCQKDLDALAERDQIRSLLDQGSQLKQKLVFDLLFDVRFLAKIAIAFGHKLFGNDYGSLRYADMLRTLLWTRRANLDPVQYHIKMRTYFNGLEDYSMKPFCFPLGFVFVVKFVEGDVALAIVFPSGHLVQVAITDKTVDTAFSTRDRFSGEHVLISVPQLRKTYGPISLFEYALWTLGRHKITELDSVKARITPRSELPTLKPDTPVD